MAVSTILSPGAKVGGKYEVVEVLGFGGMGVVYKVREQVGAVSRIRALKTVLPQFASDASVMTRFRQEAEKMCMLEHENIVPVLSYSEEGEFPYLVMPFIEGQTLKDYLASVATETNRGLPLSDVMEIGLELVRGLEVAHRFVNPESQRPQPMIHRDIKPGNIMVREENESGERRLKVLIMDFGIAKVLSDQDSGHSLTEVIGTVKYASPEQIRRGKDIDPRADIYSLGMVLYELYAGRHMFTGLSEHSVLMRMVQRDVHDLEIEFPPGTPERFRQLITRCVAVDPERRFPNVGEMRTLMRRILEEDSEHLVTEANQALAFARTQRVQAIERGAHEFANQTVAAGDAHLVAGEAALAEQRPRQALQSLRAAAERFVRAAEEAAEARRLEAIAACERLDAAIGASRSELSRLPERLREAAGRSQAGVAEASLHAARASAAANDFAGAVSAAAEGLALLQELEARRIDVLSRAVTELSSRLDARLAAVGASTGVALAAGRHAEVRATADAAQRLAGVSSVDSLAALENALGAVDALEREIAMQVEERERQLQAAERNRNAEPGAREALEALRRARADVENAGAPSGAESAALADIRQEAKRGEAELARGEYAAALPVLRSAAGRLAELAQMIARRVEREQTEARLVELRSQALQKSKALAALGAAALETADSRRLLASLTSAETQAANGDLVAAIRILEVSLPDFDRLIATARAELERARARSTADAERERAQAALAKAEALGDRGQAHTGFAPASAELERGHEAFAAERFAEAARHFSQATQALAAVISEIEEAERAERLAALARRRDALGVKVQSLPPARPFQRRRRAINKSLAAADAALAEANEGEAERRLGELESWLGALLNDAATRRAEQPRAGIPWMVVATGGSAAAAGALLLFVIRGQSPDQPPIVRTSQPPVVSEPTIRPIAPTALPEVRTTAPPRIEPTPAAVAQPTAAMIAEAPVTPAGQRTILPLVEPTVPQRAAPLALASAKPAGRTVKLRTGEEARFDASLKNGDDDSLAWRLAGQTVGRGRSILLRKEVTATPGRKHLEVVAERDGSLVSLRGWDLDIQAPPLGFGDLEPPGRRIERAPGARVGFRAPVTVPAGEKLAFLWEVNGQPARGADGPAYDFQPQRPGEYVVQVRATAPWGGSIANTWTLSVKAPIPTPEPNVEVAKADPRAEAQAWIQAYCAAFQRKDVDTLRTLGHVTSETEATRLRDALSNMNDLRVSCTNSSVRVSGDRAEVSFDRTDRWTDPRGTAMERALPRITKNLRLREGHWMVTP